jgi:hypothetical protein
VMSGKNARKKVKQAPNRQQQQEAAARRRAVGAGTSSGRAPARPSSPDQAGPSARTAGTPAPGGRLPSTLRHYLDVSVVRIQEWLARTPDLKFRRGASIMLSEATGRGAWPDTRLPHGMQWNTEAGDLDGVVSLAVREEVAESEVTDCLTAAAQQVAGALRQALPHCSIQAVVGAGEGYANAYGEIDRARRDGDLLVDFPPAPAELILAKPCDQCRAAPAEHQQVEIVGVEKREDLCGECLARVEAAGGTKDDRPHRSPRPEQRMKAALTAAGMTVKGFPDDFSQLAKAGQRDSDDAATQLALIYADGNRVGAFLSEAAEHARAHGIPAKDEIVRALDTAALAALADAITACFAGSQRPPVLAHLAGGDDLMVSLAAGDAWPFLRALLSAFQSRIGSAVDWPGPVREHLPSLSAGMVFHHQSAPFADVIRLAKGQLDTAKQATSGKGPSVAFLDLTADGEHTPAGRLPLTLADLDRRAGLLALTARIPRSHREVLVALLRAGAGHDGVGGSGGRAETPPEALARRVADLGYQPLWDAVSGPGADAQGVRSALATDIGKRNELRRILDLARWWPPPAVNGESAAQSRPVRMRGEIPA